MLISEIANVFTYAPTAVNTWVSIILYDFVKEIETRFPSTINLSAFICSLMY